MFWRDFRFYLLVLIALLLMSLSYQVRFPAWVDVGAFGDRAYLWASPLQTDQGFNGDEHLFEEGYDYRWSKRTSWVRFVDMAWNSPLQVQVSLRGWRPRAQTHPYVSVRVNGETVGQFQASGELEALTFELSEFPRHTTDIEVLLECVPFSPGEGDSRLLGVQLDWVRVDPLPGGQFPVAPAWRQLLLWGATIALFYGGLRRRLGTKAFWAGLALAVLVAAGLAFGRHWLTPYALWALYAAAALFVLSFFDLVPRWLRRQRYRVRSLPLPAALVGGGTIVLLVYIHWAAQAVPRLGPRPDAILLVIFVATATLYALLTWEQPLRRILARLDTWLRGPWLPSILLVLLLAGVTFYEFDIIRKMHFIGHADYADNGVVARNLLAGRGFTVDYVTQFYQEYPDISHPQETWPLLQPVLIAPAFHLLGDSAFAAKVPNLILQLGLALALYFLSTRYFDRRVALVAVFLTVLNRFIFRLIIFPTSDLAFTLFALLMLGQFFHASEQERQGKLQIGSYVWAGVWAGLMMLAKPNGALFIGICLLWDLFWRWDERASVRSLFRREHWHRWWRAWLAFGIPATALFGIWIGRNLFLFGTPVHSTERFDAWILKYQEWEEIYRIYFDDLPNRSWLLRYGFDRVTQAIGTEFRKWWHYFARDANALLTLTGSALSLLGLLSLRRKAGRLFSLVGAVLILFGTFICTYWHVEERYFVPFIPWLALLAAQGLWRIHDTLAYRTRTKHMPPTQRKPDRAPKQQATTQAVPTGLAWLGLAVVVLACLYLAVPFSQEAAAKLSMDESKLQELQAYQWLAENSDPEDVVMTRVPWQVTYYTQRRTVMIPFDGMEDTRHIAEFYHVDYLLMDGDARGKRVSLNQSLLENTPFKLLYDQGGVQIYQFEGR